MKKYCLFFITLFMLFGVCLTDVSGKEKISIEGKGYLGTLPDLTRDYLPKTEQNQTDEKGASSVKSIPSKYFNSENEIKPAPGDNPSFVNIILKTDKTSRYGNDLNEFIPILESLYDIIDENKNIQLFNAKVYFFNKSADYFRDKYENEPEGQFLSYKKLLELSMHTRSIALLRTESQKYNPYLAYGSEGYIYNPNNIQEQLGFLKDEIRKTILILREAI